MSNERTVPRRAAGLPIRTIRVEVTRGPDRGRTHLAGSESISVGTADGNDLVITDPTVSRYHVVLRRRGERILVEDLGSTNGTIVGCALLERHAAAVPSGTSIQIGESTLRVDDGDLVMLDLSGPSAIGELRGSTPVMRRLMATIEQIAKSDVSVLIVGESGTGKDLIAHAIHDRGTRATKPFVTVDCGAMAPTLFASELFGHERGAFTGAERRHPGAFERADGGTLFLDEIGELPADLQASLLGVLERRSVRPLGGEAEVTVNVRIAAATSRDLRSQVNIGRFRLDLYYRLAVVTLQVPPLRERTDDIPLLLEQFLREGGYAGPVGTLFPQAAMVDLKGHAWPGNVRELRNVVEATLAVGQTPPLSPPTRSDPGNPAGPANSTGATDVFGAALSMRYKDARNLVLREFERRYLRELLARAGGNVSKAATDAQMDRSYLIELLKRHAPDGDDGDHVRGGGRGPSDPVR